MSSPDARPLLSGWPVLQIASTMQVFSYFTQLFRIMDWGLAYIDFVNSFIAVLAILFSGTTLRRTLWLWPGPSPGSPSRNAMVLTRMVYLLRRAGATLELFVGRFCKYVLAHSSLFLATIVGEHLLTLMMRWPPCLALVLLQVRRVL